MSKKSPRERRQERTRQEILNAARVLVREQGADKLSLRAVARRIDYSPSGLYEYFGSKNELMEAISEESNTRLLRSMQSVSTDLAPTDYLVEIGVAYLTFARQNPEHYIFMFGNRQIEIEALDVEEYRVSAINDPFRVALNAVIRAVDEGAIQPRRQDTLTIAYQFWALVHGMAMLQVQYFKAFPVRFEDADREGIRSLIRGMSA